MRFGISTHLFHEQKLDREHLVQVASYGFEAIELFATRSHFDYHDAAAVGRLAEWLGATGLALHSVHAPITDRFASGKVGQMFSTAASDAAQRQHAVREAEAAIAVAKRIPFQMLVVHLGVPSGMSGGGDNNRGAAVRSVEEICRAAEAVGVRVAIEVIPNELSSAASLVAMLEREFESAPVGLCMDFGHAFLMGDVPDAIETAAEHLITTHVHDNKRREDDHLVPYLGSIDWSAALMTMQKIGYDGTYLMEVANTGSPPQVLEETRRARQRFERALSLT